MQEGRETLTLECHMLQEMRNACINAPILHRKCCVTTSVCLVISCGYGLWSYLSRHQLHQILQRQHMCGRIQLVLCDVARQ